MSHSNHSSLLHKPDCTPHLDLWQQFIQHPVAHSVQDPEWGIKQIKGHQPGPHICIMAAVHGNEPVGVKALLHLFNIATEQPMITQGTLSMIIGNPQAFQKGVRYLEEDLNRSFNETLSHSVEGQRAKKLRRFFQEQPVDFVLDLHSVSINNFQIVVYPKNCSHWAARLGLIPLHFAYQHEHMSGFTLIDEILRGDTCSKASSPHALVIECGGHQVPQATHVALAHIQRVLSYFEMLDDDFNRCLKPKFTPQINQNKDVKVYRSLDVIRPQQGFYFTQEVETGTCITRDEIYARDALGRSYKQTYADQAWLMMPSKHVTAEDQEAGWWCHLDHTSLDTLLIHES